jgi:hypothetical protein
LVAFGRKPSEYDPTAFQGIHAEYVLVILDEACGIPTTLWDAASTLTSNDTSRTLAIGNPDDPLSTFAKMCKPGSGWNAIQIGAEVTPNFTGEQVSQKVRSSLISVGWAKSKAKTWGERSALYTSKVKGQFPVDSDAGVIPHSWAVSCRYVQIAAEGTRCAGLDVGGGGDRTVLRERIGRRAGREKVWIESDPMVACGLIATQLKDWAIERLVVDVIGIGWGLAGRLRELSTKHNYDESETRHDAEIIPFNASGTAFAPERFVNRRAELYWEVGRERSRLKMWDLEDVDDDTLAELTEAKYVIVDSKGKIKVEPKEKIIERLGHSPDRAEALLMAFDDSGTQEAGLPLTTADLVGANVDGDVERPAWAGPKPQGVAQPDTADRDQENALMLELMAERPL